MFDFRLKVFYTVAERLNFTRAAEALFITQPAVTKHIREIEAHYHCTLFDRSGSRVRLTPAGKRLLRHTQALFAIYRDMEADMAALTDQVSGLLRIGASTTAAQYILPEYLAAFKTKFPDLQCTLTEGNTDQIESLLHEGHIDLGIVEGQSKRAGVQYKPLMQDELVLCTRKAVSDTGWTLQTLSTLPMVMREQGSGSQEVVQTALKAAGLSMAQLQIDMVMENSESIKSYLQHSDTYAFLSAHAVRKELLDGTLHAVAIEGLSISRHFYAICPQGSNHPAAALLLRLLAEYNFR